MKNLNRARAQDAIVDALSHFCVKGAVYCRSELRPPWAFSVDKQPGASFHTITCSKCRLKLEGESSKIAVCRGDLIVLPHGDAHALGDAPETAPMPLEEIVAEHILKTVSCYCWPSWPSRMQKRSGGRDLEFSGLAYCVAFNSRKAARAVTRLYDSALAPVGVRSTQLAVLIALAKSQPVSIGSLAEILSVDTTTLTRSLGPIRKQGLLAISERSAMRQRFVTLTRKGTRALTDSMPLWRDVQTRFSKAIGEDHWQLLQRELARLSATASRLELRRRQRS